MSENFSDTYLDRSIEVMQQAVRATRELILEHAGSAIASYKPDGSPVTDIDIAVEKQICAQFAADFPDVPVFGEESEYDEDLPAVCWLIDPIDGTSSYIKNIPTFTSMAVLIRDNEAIASILYNPSSDMMYTAKLHGGAYKNGVKIDLASMPLSNIALCKGRHIGPLNKILSEKNIHCEVAPEGGGFGFTLVVDGQTAARFQLHSRGYIHDYAPGALLVREAGGDIIPISETKYTFKSRSFVACHPALRQTIRDNITRIRELELEK